MAYIYAPAHTIEDYMNHVREHVGHTMRVDFTNGQGGHSEQLLVLHEYGEASNEVYIKTNHCSRWFTVAELWAYGTPQCLTCGG